MMMRMVRLGCIVFFAGLLIMPYASASEKDQAIAGSTDEKGIYHITTVFMTVETQLFFLSGEIKLMGFTLDRGVTDITDSGTDRAVNIFVLIDVDVTFARYTTFVNLSHYRKGNE